MSENNPHTQRSALGNDTMTRPPFPGSRKIYVQGTRFEDVRVPMREIRLSTAAAENGRPGDSPETVTVYDTSGPYTDPEAGIDIAQGLEPVRLKWILARGGYEELEDDRTLVAGEGRCIGNDLAAGSPRSRRPLRAKAGCRITQMHLARQGIITPEMEYVAIRENERRERLRDGGGSPEAAWGQAWGAQIPSLVTPEFVRDELARGRAILDATREHFPDAALSGEVQHEMLIDVTDHRLCHYNYWPGWVNLWPAVYGDYMVNYGRTISLAQTPLADGTERPAIDFFGPCGNTLVSGMAFGRIWPTGNPMNLLTAPGNEEKRAYLQACVDLREAAREWLEFGYLQRPVQMLTEISEVPIDDPKGRPGSIRAVLHSAWIDEAGALAFVFTNVSDEPQQFEWQADLTRYEITPAEGYRIRRILSGGERRSVGEIEVPRITRTETLDRHEIVIYEVTVGAY